MFIKVTNIVWYEKNTKYYKSNVLIHISHNKLNVVEVNIHHKQI